MSLVFGFGKPTIIVTGADNMEEKSALLILFFVLCVS
jgi:hypothetical protein